MPLGQGERSSVVAVWTAFTSWKWQAASSVGWTALGVADLVLPGGGPPWFLALGIGVFNGAFALLAFRDARREKKGRSEPVSRDSPG